MIADEQVTTEPSSLFSVQDQAAIRAQLKKRLLPDWTHKRPTLTATALTRLTFLVMPSPKKSALIIFMLFLSMHQRGRRFLWVSSNRP